MRVAASLLAGTLVLAAALVLQVRAVPPEAWAVFRYNVLILPAMLLANVLLGYGFVSASRTGWSLPATAAAFLLMALGADLLARSGGR